MAVSFDAGSESHNGTTGSASEASFSWSHTPTGTPRAVNLFVFTMANADDSTSATYGGVAMTALTGAYAVNTAVGEPGSCRAYFLGASIPTGVQTVVVNRNNNANVMYAGAVTCQAAGDTEVPLSSIVLLQGSTETTIAEQNVDDGSPGTNSLRVAGCYWGGSPAPTTGTNSTSGPNIAMAAVSARVVRETTAGQGSRPVGFTEALSDEVAAVHFAVREIPAGGATPIPVFMNIYRQQRVA